MVYGDEASTIFTRGFIDHQAPTIHQAFRVKSSFNTATSQYQSKEVSDLEETLKRLQNDNSLEANLDLDFDILKCTWDDVLHELERAQTAAEESETRGKKLHRKTWRMLGTASNILGPGLVAIPNELCVLQGGLAVMFSLARHRYQNRQNILRAFGDIPSIIMMASSKAETMPRDHPRSEQLHIMIRDLQKTLLHALPALIDRLNPGTFIQKALSPFKGADIDELFEVVRSSADRVRACAEGMMDNIVVLTHQTVHDNHKTTQNIHNITQQTEGRVEEMRGKIEQILKHQKEFQQSLDSISGKNNLLSFLMEYLKPGQDGEEKVPQTSPPVDESATPLTPKQLLQLMNVHHLGAVDAEHHIIRRSHSMNDNDISQAASMFHTTQIQQLLQSSDSGVVLVNGCTDRSQHGKISPITYVCATLTHALRRSPEHNVVLAFFCGQHSTSKDDLTGPHGLMKSLVAFLVLNLVQNAYISDTTPIWFSAIEGDIEQLSFQDICQLFYRLVKLVPKGITLHCVIDGISYYEKQVWRADYDLMMECFGGIITNKDVGTTFKLLLTSPTTSRWLPNLASHQRVSLRNSRRKAKVDPETYLKAAFENSVPQQD